MTAVLFVCLGNICRSPMAEGAFRRLAPVGFVTDSAGTGDWHRGAPPHAPAIAEAARRGSDITGQRARQLVAEDFYRFDHILVMDARNLADARALCPADGTKPRLLLDYAEDAGTPDVPDPWYTGDYAGALDLIEAGIHGFLGDVGAGQVSRRNWPRR